MQFFLRRSWNSLFPTFQLKNARHAEAGGSRQNDYRHADTAKSDGGAGKMLFDALSNGVSVNSGLCSSSTTPLRANIFRRGSFAVAMAQRWG